jgi:hypothetical protein
LFISDWKVEPLERETYLPHDTSGFNVLWGAYQLSLLAMPNGNAIIVSNHFECDFGGTDVAFMGADGEVKWLLGSFEIEPSPYRIREVGLVSNDVLALLSDDMDPIYISFEGEQVYYGSPPSVYTHILYYDDFIYGYLDHQWVQLDSAFEVINLLPVDTVTVAYSVGSSLLVQTNEGLLLMDSALQVKSENENMFGIRSAAHVGEYFGVIDSLHFYVLDSALQIIRQEQAQPQEEFNFIAAKQDTAFIWSTYHGIRHSDFVIRKYLPVPIPDIPAIDLELAQIMLPDTIFVNGYGPYSLEFFFDTFFLEVINHSADTIAQFRLELDWAAFGIQCDTYQKQWQLDSLYLLPGESRVIPIDSFTAGPISYGYHSPFCFWIESPNGLPDPDPSNNYTCEGALLATHNDDPSADGNFKIYPNPVSDEMHIEINELAADDLVCNIYSASGIWMDHFKLEDRSNTFSVRDLSDGLYFLKISDDQGHFRTQKFVVAHD